MPLPKDNSEPFTSLLHVLRQQIVPWVREKGMDNVIVAAPTWRQFQQRDILLPDGAFVTQQILKSKPVTVKKQRSRGNTTSLINARWPKDGLCSTTVPTLCFVVAGSVALSLGDYAVHCSSGQAVLMPAGTPHPDGTLLCLDETRMNNNYCSMLSLMPWKGGVDCWINHTQHGQHQSHRNPGEHCHVLHPNTSFYLESLAEAATARLPEHQLHCTGLLSALIAILVREIQQQRAFHPVGQGENSVYSAAQTSGQSPIKRAQSYIDSHLHESLTIDRVAGHLYMSRAYFTRQFRQVTGKSFLEYVTQCRLEQAKVLLVNTNWPIEKISVNIGISPKRLRNLFSQYEQQTPTAFRQQNLVDV